MSLATLEWKECLIYMLSHALIAVDCGCTVVALDSLVLLLQ